jgi:hypothetical protein
MKNNHKYLFLLLITFVSILLYSCSESNPTEPHHDHLEAEGIILKTSDTMYLKILDGKFVAGQNSIALTQDSSLKFSIYFLDHDGDIIDVTKDEEDADKKLTWVFDDNTIAKIDTAGYPKWTFSMKGLKRGETNVELQTYHVDHLDFRSIKIPVIVR